MQHCFVHEVIPNCTKERYTVRYTSKSPSPRIRMEAAKSITLNQVLCTWTINTWIGCLTKTNILLHLLVADPWHFGTVPVLQDANKIFLLFCFFSLLFFEGTNETRNIERITYILHLSAQQQNSILNNNISRISPAHINWRTKYVQYWRINIIYTLATGPPSEPARRRRLSSTGRLRRPATLWRPGRLKRPISRMRLQSIHRHNFLFITNCYLEHFFSRSQHLVRAAVRRRQRRPLSAASHIHVSGGHQVIRYCRSCCRSGQLPSR